MRELPDLLQEKFLFLAVGNTDGRVNGTRYFRCEENRGKFVRLDDIMEIMQSKVSIFLLKAFLDYLSTNSSG